jgi:hypothetical protein
MLSGKISIITVVRVWEEYPWRWVFGRYIIANREHHIGAMKNEHAIFNFERGELSWDELSSPPMIR